MRYNLPRRPRRLRPHRLMRDLVRENPVSASDLIWTVVISDSEKGREAVPSMPGVDRLGVTEAVEAARHAHKLGIPAIALFPHINPDKKDETASEALNADGLVPEIIRAVKKSVPEIGIIARCGARPFYQPWS